MASFPFTLEFDAPNREPAQFVLKEGETIKLGRNPKLDVPFDVLRISWVHCEIIVRSSDGSPQLVIKDLSSNGTGLQPDGQNMRKMSKGEEVPLENGIRVVMPVKLQAKKDDTEERRESFVVKHGHPAAQEVESVAQVDEAGAASAGAMAAAALLTADPDEDESSSSSSEELQPVLAIGRSEAAAAAAAAAAAKAQADAQADAKRREREEAERAAAEKALREKKAAETAKRTAEQAAEIQRAAFEKAMSEFRQKRKQPPKGEQAEAEDAEEPAKRAKQDAAGDAVGRLLAADAAAQLPASVLPKFERGEALVLKGNTAETLGKAEEAFENYKVGLAVILQEVLPHLGQKVPAELHKHVLKYLDRAESLKARWGGGLPPARRVQ